jgi:hypothetical protein
VCRSILKTISNEQNYYNWMFTYEGWNTNCFKNMFVVFWSFLFCCGISSTDTERWITVLAYYMLKPLFTAQTPQCRWIVQGYSSQRFALIVQYCRKRKAADWWAILISNIQLAITDKNSGISGEASPTIWSCYANFKSSLFTSLEIWKYIYTEIFAYIAWPNCRAGFATEWNTC